MKKCLIVGGAGIDNYNRIAEGLKRQLTAGACDLSEACSHDASCDIGSSDESGYFTILCDSGLKHMDELNLKPDLVVGDFDSHENPHLPVETIVLPTVKDDTDTVYALKEAVARGYSDFVLIGAVGGRFDHSLGNIAILTWLEAHGLKGVILDDYSEMEMISAAEYSADSGKAYRISDEYRFFSLVNITGTAKGITIRNARYNLDKAEITCEYAYGVSNEVLTGKTAEITIDDGKLLVIKDWE